MQTNMNNLLIISTCVATLRLAPTKYACALFLETEVVSIKDLVLSSYNFIFIDTYNIK
jgi:hypothetical protein